MIGINQQPSTAVMIRTEEDEFIKRNTDCVYFLASPLTCKKGSECEYRHSDIARVNPRDCYYWFNGNCLNPKCAFRHPPLDGLLGVDDSTPVGTTVTQAPVKKGIACVFFQKGFCLKGHFCPFVHGSPNVFNNKVAQPVPHNTVIDPSKVASACPEKPIQKTAQKPSKEQPRYNNGGDIVVMEKKVALSLASVVPPPVMNESPVNRSNDGVYEDYEAIRYVSDNEGFNGKDFDEYSREPSPGFDVLVDTEVGDSEYYASEERFDMGRSVDFDVDQDMYNEQRDFDHYNKVKEFFDFERKRYSSPDQFDFDKSDLRHQISKQRRGDKYNVGGLKSVVTRENPGYGYTDRSHDRHGDPGQLSSRLRGRIKIPGRSMSPGNANGFRSGNYKSARRDYITSRGKSQHADHGQTLGKRKYPRVESQQSEVNGSFEGPKPLSEILKRKRGSVICYVNKEEVD